MNKYYTYIATDANRRYLQAGLTTSLNGTQQEISQGNPALFPFAVLNRMVLVEAFDSMQAAEKRLSELNGMCRLVKERLIRKQNPNWLSLNLTLPRTAGHKKTVVYA